METDPFINFLSDLSKKIQNEKEHKTLIEKINTDQPADTNKASLENVILTIKEKIAEKVIGTALPIIETTESTPLSSPIIKRVTEEENNFGDFVSKLKNILNKDTAPIKEEIIEQPETTTITPVSTAPVIDKNKSKKTVKADSSYIEVLEQLKDGVAIEQEDSKVTEIKKLIEEYAEKYIKKAIVMSEYAGGGGTNAVQYANGGTMNGDLNVNANYLSGGVNLLDIFALQPDLDNQTLTYNDSNYNLSISNGNTVNLSSINTTFNANSGKYESVYTTVSNSSADWSSVYTNVNSNSAYYALTNQDTVFEKNVTIQGNLTALGTSTFQNTIFTTTSALSVVSLGPGPALYVYQAAGPYDVASFYDGDGIEVLHVGNAQGGGNPLGQVGINTSFPTAELTVNGAISSRGNLFSPSFATFVKNSSYPTLSSTLTNNSGYFNSQGTFASPGGFIIKGHSPVYNTSIQNLPEKGTYGLWLQNVDNMDPGTTFASDGRAQVTHAMSFRAGINNFTAGSDHNHVQWQGAPSNSTQAWQMTNGGNATNVYGYQFPYTNRFMVHTLPQYQYNTTITAISGFIDTREANLVTGTDRVSGVKLLVSRDVSTGNYNLLNVGEVIGLTINPGLVGLIAATYNSQVTQISANATLSSFQFNAYIGNGDNWKPAQKGIQPISLLSRTNGGNPGVSLVTSQIGTDPSTQYVGLTGSYRGINKHMLARFTSSTLLSGYKTGAPLTLWIPPLMPSSSPIGTGIISSDKITTFAQGTFPTGVRSGYFDAYVVSVSGTDLEFSIGNLMDSYSFENRSWPYTAAGNAGWLLYGGSQDTVHRPTFGTTGFYFEREPWNVGSVNWLSGGMVKNVVLGTSESYGNFSYGLGWRGVVLGDKSGTFAGDYNTVFGNNSVALGGEGLISLSSTPYQAVVGKYNNPNNNALLVVGAGTSNTNRVNILEVEASQLTVNGTISTSGGNSNQWASNWTTTNSNSGKWESTYSTLCAISAFRISNTITPASFPNGYTLSNSDLGRTYHVDTRSAPVSVLLPSNLTNDFSVTLVTLGTNNMHVSSSQVPMLCATGTKVNLAFASTFIYKYDNLLWGLGSLI